MYTAIWSQCVLFSEHSALLSVPCVVETSICAVRDDIPVNVDIGILLSGQEGKKLKETGRIRRLAYTILVPTNVLFLFNRPAVAGAVLRTALS